MEGVETQDNNNNCTVTGQWNFTITYWNGGDLNNPEVAGYARYKLENYLSWPNGAFDGWSGFGSDLGIGVYSFYHATDGNQVRNVLRDALYYAQDELSAVGISVNISSFSFNSNVSCIGEGGVPFDPNSVAVGIDANHARLCGVIAVVNVAGGYAGGVNNLGFTLTRTINGGNSVSAEVLIGSACFSTKNENAALSTTAIIAAYNMAVEAIVYEVKYGIISTVNSVTLRAALIAQIKAAIVLTGGYGSTFSSGACVGTVPETTATYCP